MLFPSSFFPTTCARLNRRYAATKAAAESCLQQHHVYALCALSYWKSAVLRADTIIRTSQVQNTKHTKKNGTGKSSSTFRATQEFCEALFFQTAKPVCL